MAESDSWESAIRPFQKNMPLSPTPFALCGKNGEKPTPKLGGFIYLQSPTTFIAVPNAFLTAR
jgi:hypothetical protein